MLIGLRGWFLEMISMNSVFRGTWFYFVLCFSMNVLPVLNLWKIIPDQVQFILPLLWGFPEQRDTQSQTGVTSYTAERGWGRERAEAYAPALGLQAWAHRSTAVFPFGWEWWWFSVLPLGHLTTPSLDFPDGSVVKNPPAAQETRVRSLGQEDPWRRKRQPLQRSLVGYSPCVRRVGHNWVTNTNANLPELL